MVGGNPGPLAAIQLTTTNPAAALKSVMAMITEAIPSLRVFSVAALS
jgi:hypothetical protein